MLPYYNNQLTLNQEDLKTNKKPIAHLRIAEIVLGGEMVKSIARYYEVYG